MPSPLIPHSKSVPNIPDTHHSLRSRSSHPADTAKSPWPKKESVSTENPSGSSSKNLHLTKESLEELIKRHGSLDDKRYPTINSPCSKGLTDFSSAVSRQKQLSQRPGRESYAAKTNSVGSNPVSRLAFKVQEWTTSFFPFSGKGMKYTSSGSFQDKRPEENPNACSSSSSRRNATVTSKPRTTARITAADVESVEEEEKGSCRKCDNTASVSKDQKALGEKPLKPSESIEKEVKERSNECDNSVAVSNNSKPSRERPSEPPPPPPLAPQTSQASLPSEYISQIKPGHCPAVTLTTHDKKLILEQDISMPWNDRLFFWADKYRPLFLKDFLCNRNKALELQAMTRNGKQGHFIFEGPPGVGKRTMIEALLREVFGPDKLEAKEESKEIYLKGEAVTSIRVNVKVSPKHVEVNLSEHQGYEKHVIAHLIAEENRSSSAIDFQLNHNDSRAIVLYGADKLSTEVVVYIRWLLERYKGCSMIHFSCKDATQLQPVKSICKLVQLLRPSSEEILNVLKFIAKQEGIRLPHQLAVKIANNSKNNLGQAIRSFEATWHFNPSLDEDQEIVIGWEDDIKNIARNIIEEQSLKQLYIVRRKLKKLIEHNVSPEFVFKMLVEEIKKNIDEELHQQINKLLRKYNINCEKRDKRDDDPVTKNVQQFMEIEEFIAKFMSWNHKLLKRRESNQMHQEGTHE